MEVIAKDVMMRLEGALEDVSGRDEKLSMLFEDVCHSIDDVVKTSIEPEYRRHALYYEAISNYLENDVLGEAIAAELLPLFNAMWDANDVRNTFTLLMHRWIFRQGLDICRSLNVITKGANSLFWMDLMTQQYRFQTLFLFLAQALTTQEEANMTIEGTNYVFLVKLTSRFICFYHMPPASQLLEDLTTFVQAMEKSAWWSRCVGPDEDISGAASMLVMELAHQLEHIRSEELLGEHLIRMRTLKPVIGTLEIHARIRLENILHALGHPGGPLYPPRGVRIRARNLMDLLFPKGRHSRGIVHLSFRLLNPYRWPVSLAHFVGVQLPTQAWTWTIEHVPTPLASLLTSVAARARHLIRGGARGGERCSIGRS